MSGNSLPTLIRVIRDGGDSDAIDPPEISERVRELRGERGWSLYQASHRAGLSAAALSKIENGQMSPTYEAVKKLAAGLGLSVPRLFTPRRRRRMAGRLEVTRPEEGIPHETETSAHSFLGGAVGGKRMLPCHGRIRARSLDEHGGWTRHEGEEFLYVLSGTVRLHTEGNAPVVMQRGDSAYYDATTGHNLVSLGEEDATVLWVTSIG